MKLARTVARKKIGENLSAHVVLRDLEGGPKAKAEVLRYVDEPLIDTLVTADYVVEWKGILQLTDVGTIYIER